MIGWLQERGCSDPNLDVRLGGRPGTERWRDDARLLPWLRARTPYYQGGNLVFKAVREVAIRRQQDPGTVAWLKALASRDEPDWVLRNSAIVQLQQEWREDKDVAVFLKELGRPPEEFWSDSPMTTLTRLLASDY